MLIAGLYAGLGALVILVLAVRVMWLRNKLGVGLGAGGHEELQRAIRAHANAIEYVPVALLLLVVLAFEGTQPWLLNTCGGVLIVARILHALGLSAHSGRSFGRALGAGLTVLVLLVMAIVLVVRFVMG